MPVTSDSHPNIELMQPFARKLLRAFGIGVSIYFVAVFMMDNEVSLLWGVLMAAAGLIFLYLSTMRVRLYYTPVIISIFYFLGYLLSGSYVLLNKDAIPRTGFGTIGSFMFTDAGFMAILFSVTAGISGVVTAALLAEKLFRCPGSQTVQNVRLSPAAGRRFWMWMFLWGGGSLGIVFFMWVMEIGRTGLVGVELPFKLSGVLFYVRMIVIPFIGMLLLDICVTNGRKKAAISVLILLTLIGFVMSLGATSRGAFVFTTLPAVLFLLFNSCGNNLSRKLFVVFSAVTVSITAAVVFFVGISREHAFSGKGWNLAGAISLYGNIDYSEQSLSQLVQDLLSLMTARVGGLRELMAVIGSNVADITSPLKIFMGTMPVNDLMSIIYSVMGFIPYTDDTVAFGVALGAWGQLFLSNSYFVVYFGTLLLVGLIICVEELFRRNGVHAAALLFAILLGFQFWGGASLFGVSRLAVMVVFCYFLMKHANNRFLSVTKSKLPQSENTYGTSAKI